MSTVDLNVVVIGLIVDLQLEGFGWSQLTNVDTNADNFCGAGIVHTAVQQIGVLYRLEPKKDAKVSEPDLCAIILRVSLIL